jgi:hypothetical protein
MKKIPCKSTCPKCGSQDIQYLFVYKDLDYKDIITRMEFIGGKFNPQLSNEFVQFYGTYRIHLQDYIQCSCKCCEYLWQIKPLGE